MGRVEENSEAIAPIIRAVSPPYVIGSIRSKEFELSLLCDISKSLAVIADKLSKGNDKLLCDGCKHKKFPDGDGACLTCCEYYDCQYEEE